MARGNQRELARAKNQKKTEQMNKGKREPGALSVSAQKELDAQRIREKQAAANKLREEKEKAELEAKFAAINEAKAAAIAAAKKCC